MSGLDLWAEFLPRPAPHDLTPAQVTKLALAGAELGGTDSHARTIDMLGNNSQFHPALGWWAATELRTQPRNLYWRNAQEAYEAFWPIYREWIKAGKLGI